MELYTVPICLFLIFIHPHSLLWKFFRLWLDTSRAESAELWKAISAYIGITFLTYFVYKICQKVNGDSYLSPYMHLSSPGLCWNSIFLQTEIIIIIFHIPLRTVIPFYWFYSLLFYVIIGDVTNDAEFSFKILWLIW